MSNQSNRNTFYLLIISVLLIIVLLNKCGNGCNNSVTPNGNDTISQVHDTIYEVVEKEIPHYVPVPSKKLPPDTVFYPEYVMKDIDTAAILKDYFSSYIYNDTIPGDTLNLFIIDTISKNKIQGRQIKYNIKYSTIKTTTTILETKHEFYVGGELIGNKTGINYLGSEFLWRTKKKRIYGIGIGIDGNFEPQLSINTHWKIGKK